MSEAATKKRTFTKVPLGFPWHTRDPFLFCVHHLDHYPNGNAQMGPAASLAGRDIGMDFTIKDGWRMYHGQHVPGFPSHPHRGFETVTVARRGYIDHSDSMGAAARYGQGDVQWMTAGKGIVHSEMFPLVEEDEDNTVELFQIWLNLPRRNKMSDPHFSMFWQPEVPVEVVKDSEGRKTELVIVAGAHAKAKPPKPPPKSWASEDGSDVAIWTIRMEPGATVKIPAASKGVNRTLYFFEGHQVMVDGHPVTEHLALDFHEAGEVEIINGSTASELLMLQGKPIAEPTIQHGPFVMNTREEIYQAMVDYQRTGFGGWPWKSNEPVHPRTDGRFARHADGRVEKGPKTS